MHSVKGRYQKAALVTAGLGASALLLTASGVMNWRYGCSLGKSPMDCQIYGAAAAAADVFMAISPFFFFAALKNREIVRTLCALIVWVICTGFAFTSAIGHASVNRLDTAGKRTVAADAYKDLRADKKRNEQQLGWLPAHRAADTVKADLQGVKAHRFWIASTECTEATGKSIREFCGNYHKLAAELANATKADDYNKKIEEIGGKLEKATTAETSVESEADPGAQTISAISGWDLRTSQGALSALVVLMILCCAGLGPYVSMSMYPDQRRFEAIEGTAKDITPAAEAAPEAVPDLSAPALEAPQPQALLPQPEPAEPANEPVPMPTRAPLPGSEASLLEISFPVDGVPSGPKRDKRPPKEAAQAFLVWLRAYDLVREPLTGQDVTRLYEEFCEADHRHPTAENNVSGALKNLKGVHWGKPVVGDGKKLSRYTIKPGKYPKPTTPPVTENPKQEGRLFVFPRPLAEAPAHDDVSAETTDQPARVDEIAKRRQVQFDHPVLNAARAHWMRRDARHMHRKQRGARSGRRAA